MPQPEPPTFHLRLPQRLKDQLNKARGRNSLNREIVERLERTFDLEPSLHLAEIFRPLLALLDDDERAKVMEHVGQAAEVIAKAARNRRR